MEDQLVYDGAIIQIYQILSYITLQHRRSLKRLLAVHQEHNIAYQWHFISFSQQQVS